MERLHRRIAELERRLDHKRWTLQRQLALAAKVHGSLLPKAVRHERIHVDVRYLPIEEVGGDYCQVIFPDPTTCCITVCDVTGHGIGAGLLATRVSSEVRYHVLRGYSPHEMVRALNTFICDQFEETGLYLTFVAARIDLESRIITWSGAGHPCPLLIRRNPRTVERLESLHPLIGVMTDGFDERAELSTHLEPGDRLIFYTDGITETANIHQRMLGIDGLGSICAEAMSVDLFAMADFVLQMVTGFQHGPVTDDKTLIVAEIR
jgi:serine phosphatase RsbU (regulator of sigma subunit)